MVKGLVLRRPLQGALYLLPLFLHLLLEAIHVLLVLFAVTETPQVIPRTPFATRAAAVASVRPPEPFP